MMIRELIDCSAHSFGRCEDGVHEHAATRLVVARVGGGGVEAGVVEAVVGGAVVVAGEEEDIATSRVVVLK